MNWRLPSLLLAIAFLPFHAYSEPGDDGPPISITSPDAGTTFAFGEIKNHSLIWDKKEKMLVAHVTFTDTEVNFGQASEDYHEFRLPGVTFDEAKGIFSATTAKGEVIPVARIKKVLFTKAIQITPNAAIRILHPRGEITVILEAISPNDPAMQPKPDDGDGTQQMDIKKILN
jgi:hypothetical protein